MPTSIAIICTLDELMAYSLAEVGAANANRYFGLNLSVGFRGDLALPDASVSSIFQPWALTSLSIVAYVDSGKPGDAPSGKIVNAQVIASPALSVPIAQRLAARYDFRVQAADEPYFLWTDDPTNFTSSSGETWPRVLAHASTYPSPVAQSLNLAFVFKIAASDLKDQTGKDLTRLWVAPNLKIDATTSYQLTPTPMSPVQSFAEWQYASSPASFPLSACQPEYLLKSLVRNANPPHFIDLQTGWIATSDGTDQTTPAETIPSEDWRSTLERRVDEAFDLGQRILVALRPQLTTLTLTIAQTDQLRDAILAVLRDTADLGLRYGPDGTSLFRFVLTRAGVSETDTMTIETALHQATSGQNAPDTPTWAEILIDQQIVASIPTASTSSSPVSQDYIQSTLDMLENIQTALASDSNLANIVFAQWNKYAAGLSVWNAVSNAVQSTLGSLASSRLLRARLLLGNVGGQAPASNTGAFSSTIPIWTALTSTLGSSGYTAETKAVQQNLQDLIGAYYCGRFGISSTDARIIQLAPLFANRAPVATWPQGVPDLTTSLQSNAATFGQTLFPTAVQQSAASHSIFVQVSDTTSDPSVAPTDDSERKIAGLGLLIREGSAAWTCANVADVYAANNSTAPLMSSTPVPLRLKTRNSLKQPVISYNGGSLIAQFPEDPNNTSFPNQGTQFPQPDPKLDFSQLFQYQLPLPQGGPPPQGNVTYQDDGTNFTLTFPSYSPPGDTTSDWGRVPTLKYGRTYTFLPFFIGNGGTLPPLLGSSANPFTPVQPSKFVPPGAGYLRTVTYNRRVAVGAPRWKRAATPNPDMPEIPDTVVPLARDFLQTQDSPAPILLLWSYKDSNRDYSSYSFILRPPACDLDTWDRWVAALTESPADKQAGKTFRFTRMAIATAVNRYSAKTIDDQNVPDLSLDDPAVTAINFTLEPVYSASTASATLQTWPTGPQASSPTYTGQVKSIFQALLSTAQSPGVTVNCTISPPGLSVSFNLVGSVLSVSVPAGEVWKLTATPQAAGAFEPNPPVIGTFELLIEVPVSGVFAPGADTSSFSSKLWNQLSVAVASGGTPPAVVGLNVGLAPWATSSHDSSRDLLRGVSVRRQAWRWMGRPVAPYPTDWLTATLAGDAGIDADPSAAGGAPNSRTWEVGSFAERPDNDSIVKECSVNFAASTATPVQLLQLDLSHDMKAQYYRFTLDAHSRYVGLPSLSLATVRATATGQATDPNGNPFTWATNWKRQVVPSRVSGPIPKPKVSLVLPFTIPDSSEGGTLPDLLVIANERWFQIGGLAEELYAQIVPARDPSVPLAISLSQANPLPEVGPNPILGDAAFDEGVLQPAAHLLPADPIGTTFDLETSAPLFGNTCFRIKASMLSFSPNGTTSVLPASGLEHNFVKVRLTRKVNRSIIGPAQTDLESDPTEPFWVEFQPSFTHCNTAKGLVPVDNSLRFSMSSTGAISFTSKGSSVQLVSGPPTGGPLELWILLMKTIRDVNGNSQLVALDMVGPNGTTTPDNAADVVVYLLEVLCAPGFSGQFVSGVANAEAMLFPDPAGSDPNARARIQRCSPPIHSSAWVP